MLDKVREMETNCKLLWCKVGIQGVKQLLIGAYYHTKEEDADSCVEFAILLNRLGNKDDRVLLGGDSTFLAGIWKPNNSKRNAGILVCILNSEIF